MASLCDCVSYFSFIVLFQHIQIMCVCILFQFLFFNFEFYVVVNVLFGMTAYGHLITQCGLLHHLFGLLESLVSLTFNLPLIFVSMFQYQSWTIKHPTYNNPRLHHPLSSLLIDYTGMIRCPSIHITLSLWFLSNDIIYVFRYEIGRWRERSRLKMRNQLWFGILFSLQISNLIFDSHPYKISCLNSSITAAQGYLVMETSGLLNF